MALTYAIIGTGGIGGYYGGRLANAGKEVHFLFHSDYEHVKQHGLKVDSERGDFHLKQINAYNSTLQMPKCDVILVALKTTANHILPEILPPILHEKSVIVLIQNGLGIEQELADAIPNANICGGTAFICSTKIGAGHIYHAELGSVTIAPHCGNCNEVLQELVADFASSDLEANIADDLNSIRWKKLVWNIPYNGLAVILQTSTDKLTFALSSRQLILDIMNEVVEAGRLCGAKISDQFISKMLTMTENMLNPYKPSMRVDFDAHRPMEIHAMYTNPIAIAKQAGYYMHKTEMLEQQLRFVDYNA